MRPNRFMGMRCILSFAFSKTRRSGLWLMRLARGNRNGASLPERFTVRTHIGMQTLVNFEL